MKCWRCPRRGSLWLPVGGAEVWLCRPCALILTSNHDRCAKCGHLRFASVLAPDGACGCPDAVAEVQR